MCSSFLQVPKTPQPGLESTDSRRLATKHSRKALKASLTLGILLGMFFVTWLPFFVANIIQVMPQMDPGCGGATSSVSPAQVRGGRGWPSPIVPMLVCVFHLCWVGGHDTSCPPQAVCDCISPGLFDVLTWLGYCNSTMNPIIYPLFMRDFKRALGKFLPCPHCPPEPRATPASPSMRTSHSGARPGLSLQHVLPLPLPLNSSDSDSGGSSGLQLTTQLLLPGEATRDPLPPPRPAAAVNFFNINRAEPELRLHPLGTPTN